MNQIQTGASSGAAVVAASLLTGVNQLLVNVQPLLFGVLAVRLGLDDAELGYLGAVVIAALTLGSISGPFWVRRANWRFTCALALVGAAAAFALGAAVTTLDAALLLFGAAGLFLGLLSPPAFGCLGEAKNPPRAFAISVVAQSSLAAASTLALSFAIIPRFGAPGTFVSVAVAVAAALPLCRSLPRGAGSTRELSATVDGAPLLSRAAIPAYAMLFAKGVFVAGILGYWIFVERIGVAHGIPGERIGLTISLCAVASAASAGIVGWLAGRVRLVPMIAIGTTIVIGAFIALGVPGFLAFALSNFLFAFGWGFAQSAYWGLLREVDATNRLFVAGPAAAGVGGVAAGMAAGPIIAVAGLSAMTLASGVALLAAALVAFLVAGSLRVRRSRAAGPDTRAPEPNEQALRAPGEAV
ncbi:hypothetical protein ACWKWJ_11085 [Sphingopyxis terrae subsp. ummariensis]